MRLREPWRHPLTRLASASLAFMLAAGMAGGPDDAAAEHSCAHPGGPSKLDYMVLASIADSPHLLAMASYRAADKRRGDMHNTRPRPYPTAY